MAARRSRVSASPPKPKVDPATQYALDVVSGRIVAGPHVRNSCRRHLRDLEEGPKRGLNWDVAAAMRTLNFFPDVLRLNGGQFEGKPFDLHSSQQFLVGSLFGWKRADGTRRFRRAYIEQGKGNGKSPLAAGIGLYCLLADNEPRAEVYAAAADKDQAMVLFRDAVAMRELSPALESRLTTSGGNPVWNLADVTTGSFFRPISSEKRKSGSGPRPSCALCDEVHEHPDRLMIEMLERGFKWRRQPLLIMITNSGSDRNSIAWEEREHACKVAAGTTTPDDDFTFVGEAVDDDSFSYVCGLDKDDKPLDDPSTWIKANPLLGVTIQADYLAGVVRQAKSMPGKMNSILRLHLCQWTDADEAWMSRQALESVLSDFDPIEHVDEDVSIGIDLSGSQDMTAMAFVVQTGEMDVPRLDGTTARLPTYDAWVEAWTPKETLAERALTDRAPYEVWVEQGWLRATPGKTIRMDFVAARLAEIAAEYSPRVVAYDRYAFKKFEEECDGLGLTLQFVEHPQGGKRRARPTDEATEAAKTAGEEPPQGLWMPGSLSELETLILEGRIRLRRSPVLISACMSAAIERDPFDNRWFSKRKATNRIDAVVALAMAVGAATMSAPPPVTTSIYDMPGMWGEGMDEVEAPSKPESKPQAPRSIYDT